MFINEAYIDFTKKENREWIPAAIMNLRGRLPLKVPVTVDGRVISGLAVNKVQNPSDHRETVAENGMATQAEADAAILACEKAKKTWGHRPVRERADIIRKAADLMVRDKKELICVEVLEEAKPFKEADADVCEAIDFCRYYADEAERIFRHKPTTDIPGETNHYHYIPKGTCLTVAPWNFPLAILCGMTVAPLVCGDPVIMKPSNQAPAIGYELFKRLIEAGVPKEAVHFMTGSGRNIGDYLVRHPKVHMIAFTGSRDVGLHIVKEAALVHEGQRHVKKVIAEMGGKNAVIIDDDADLDVAVIGCLYSAFGFAGQKCSALSRLIILDNIYDKFKTRFVEGMKSLKVGIAEDLDTKIPAVIDVPSRDRLMSVIERHQKNIAGQIDLTPELLARGNFVPPTVFESDDMKSELGQEEFFGPLVTLFKAKDINAAIDLANDSEFALTGGVYSRSPSNIENVKKFMECGNLYINRQISGALVNRQPFGGFKLSGAGGKAGGPDYLLHFTEPRTITENTMRRGFAPEV
ncbi:MAG: aldehyde dehydrogenase family protein [Deltaproteobacteria bacterium]|nr:aldehyde dehydrogenase family protein [Deltaproteobacteria bacterium]